MQKEIFEQPESVFNTMRGRVNFETNTGKPLTVPWADRRTSLGGVSINALCVPRSAPGRPERPLEGDPAVPPAHRDWLWNQLPRRRGRECNALGP